MGYGRHDYDDAALRRVYDGMAASYRWVSLVNDTVSGATRLRRWVMTQAHGDVLDVDLLEMSAQRLDFPDGTFDTVTTAMSTCTFPDPVGALREMARVTRPDGRMLLLEHGRSRVDWIARVQDHRADRHHRRTGCRSNQDVTAVLTAADLRIDATRSRTMGVFTAVVARPTEPRGPG